MHLVTSGTLGGLMLVRRYLEGIKSGLFESPNDGDQDFKPLSDDDIVCVG